LTDYSARAIIVLQRVGGNDMSASKLETHEGAWSAAELRRLTRQEQDAVLASAAARAEEEYRTNRELTAFDAFGGLHADSAGDDNQPR
jgi:hypothetical protein